MKTDELDAWTTARGKGMLRYVLVHGVFSYGLAMFIAMTFIAHSEDLSASFIAVSAVLCALGGALFGIAMWYIQERKYGKAQGNRSDQ